MGMKYNTENYILFFILGFFLILIIIHSYYFYRFYQDSFTTFLYQNQPEAIKTEPFQPNSEIDYYVITMKNKERIENINQQKNKLKQQGTPIDIELVDAVVGVDLNLNELIKTEILSPHYKSGYGDVEKLKKKEIGCYMSHLKIYEMIQKQSSNKKYSVIFEDDFNIVSEHFVKEIENSLDILEKKQLYFDLLYLGTNYENIGKLIENHTYAIDKNNILFGTHAILINNQNITKIIKAMTPIKQPIDVQYTELCQSEKLNAYIQFPILVKQQFDKLKSTITSENFELELSKMKPSDYE